MARDDIELHPDKGLNVHITFCPRCRGDSNGLAMLGSHTHRATCSACKAEVYGVKPHTRTCGLCGARALTEHKLIEDYERVPGDLCKECEEQVAAETAEVAAGGILFRCKCGARGVIKHDADICAAVRLQLNCPPPKPCGIDLDSCPQCSKPEAS